MDILIPVKGFHSGKSRLSAMLSPGERAALCRKMFERTLEVTRPLSARLAVVTADDEVAVLAEKRGALVLRDPGLGLNAGLTEGARLLSHEGPLAILPTDLPGLTSERLAPLLALPDVVLVPDRHGDGTNLMVLPSAVRSIFAFAYGPGSLARHRQEALRLGQTVSIRPDPILGHDIDTEEDLLGWPILAQRITPGRDHEAA